MKIRAVRKGALIFLSKKWRTLFFIKNFYKRVKTVKTLSCVRLAAKITALANFPLETLK